MSYIESVPDQEKQTKINIPSREGVSVEQMSTRGDGSIEVGQEFNTSDVDYSSAVEHLAIHMDGDEKVAGSQFSGDIFNSPDDVVEMVKMALPGSINYDQHNRAEITISVEGSNIGYSGVKSLEELKQIPGATIEKGIRIPGGELEEVDGVKGAWYPETKRTEKGNEVIVDESGNVLNPHFKFEPEVWIAKVDDESAKAALSTNKMTVIIQKSEGDVPKVLTIFPGENAPALPAKIEKYGVDTLQAGPETSYWEEHAFIKAA